MSRYHSVVRNPVLFGRLFKDESSPFDALSSSEYSDHSYFYSRNDDDLVQGSSYCVRERGRDASIAVVRRTSRETIVLCVT